MSFLGVGLRVRLASYLAPPGTADQSQGQWVPSAGGGRSDFGYTAELERAKGHRPATGHLKALLSREPWVSAFMATAMDFSSGDSS